MLGTLYTRMGAHARRSVSAPGADLRVTSVALVLRWASSRLWCVEGEIEGLRPFVSPGAVCLDIGAEYGLYAWCLSVLAGPRGAVHCVEPLPGPARWLSTTAAALGCDNVAVHRIALSERPLESTMSLPCRGILPVHGRAYLTEGAVAPGPNVEFARSRLVSTPVRTLDGLCHHLALDRVDFIKADIEGAEGALLSGGWDTLLRHRPTVLLEIEDRHLAKYGAAAADIVSRLGVLDYDMYRWQRPVWERSTVVSGDCRNYLFTTLPVPSG